MPRAVCQIWQCASCTILTSRQLFWESWLNIGKRQFSAISPIRRVAPRSNRPRQDPSSSYLNSNSESRGANLKRSFQAARRSVPKASSLKHRNLKIQPHQFLGADLRNDLLVKVSLEQFASYRHDLFSRGGASLLQKELGVKSPQELQTMLDSFDNLLKQGNSQTVRWLFDKLRTAFSKKDAFGLQQEIQNAFAMHALSVKFSKEGLQNQKKLADLRHPLEWFPATRAMQRKIHLHVGPTNSGKTYRALQKLEAAESGIYAGPLRLLAHEVYTRLNSKGRHCALITGEEQRIPENQDGYLSSCTVEMVPLNVEVDVAVIDEIQMMGDDTRGWAWTQAFLGVMAKEVHLCGEERTIPLIRDLCAAMGDSLEIHKYERLSPLKSMTHSLDGNLKHLRKGDAVIAFSRLGIHAMKAEIEKVTGKRCAIVYGSLPPETRAQQAALFNDPNNEYDILVASDAIGMGLNLAIKRVIFETTWKFDGAHWREIKVHELKQIAGRAGRYKTALQAINRDDVKNALSTDGAGTLTSRDVGGLVTSLEPLDLPFLRRSMVTEPDPLASAGILPPDSVMRRFAAYFPEDTPFSLILLRLHEICSVHPRFHLCLLKDHLQCADVIQQFNLTVSDRLSFIAGPTNLRITSMIPVVQALARAVANQTGGNILEMPEFDLELIDSPGFGKEHLNKLEILHKALGFYLWLSYRFTGAFRSQAVAFEAKRLVEEKIDEALAGADLRGYQDHMKRGLAKARAQAKAMEGLRDTGDNSNNPQDTPLALPLVWDQSKIQESLLDPQESETIDEKNYV